MGYNNMLCINRSSLVHERFEETTIDHATMNIMYLLQEQLLNALGCDGYTPVNIMYKVLLICEIVNKQSRGVSTEPDLIILMFDLRPIPFLGGCKYF